MAVPRQVAGGPALQLRTPVTRIRLLVWPAAPSCRCSALRQAEDSPRRAETASLPYSVLAAGVVAGIDNKRKEHYLTEEEFQRVLGMARPKFEALPEWRRNELKRRAGIF